MAFKIPKTAIKNCIPKDVLLSHVGKSKSEISRILNVGSERLLKSIVYHKLEARFPARTISELVVPSYNISISKLKKYYGLTLPAAAKKLKVPQGTLRSGVERKGLLDNFVGEQPMFNCCICRVNKVTARYKMCEQCKGPAWYH